VARNKKSHFDPFEGLGAEDVNRFLQSGGEQEAEEEEESAAPNAFQSFLSAIENEEDFDQREFFGDKIAPLLEKIFQMCADRGISFSVAFVVAKSEEEGRSFAAFSGMKHPICELLAMVEIINQPHLFSHMVLNLSTMMKKMFPDYYEEEEDDDDGEEVERE